MVSWSFVMMMILPAGVPGFRLIWTGIIGLPWKNLAIIAYNYSLYRPWHTIVGLPQSTYYNW